MFRNDPEQSWEHAIWWDDDVGMMAGSQVYTSIAKVSGQVLQKSILGRLLIWSGSKTVKIWEKSVSDNLIGGRWVGEDKAWKDLERLQKSRNKTLKDKSSKLDD